jgi:hypothetical protein
MVGVVFLRFVYAQDVGTVAGERQPGLSMHPYGGIGLLALLCAALGCDDQVGVVGGAAAAGINGGDAGRVAAAAQTGDGSCNALAVAYCDRLRTCLPHDAEID